MSAEVYTVSAFSINVILLLWEIANIPRHASMPKQVDIECMCTIKTNASWTKNNKVMIEYQVESICCLGNVSYCKRKGLLKALHEKVIMP